MCEISARDTIGGWLGGFIWGWLLEKGGDSRGVARVFVHYPSICKYDWGSVKLKILVAKESSF